MLVWERDPEDSPGLSLAKGVGFRGLGFRGYGSGFGFKPFVEQTTNLNSPQLCFCSTPKVQEGPSAYTDISKNCPSLTARILPQGPSLHPEP